MVIFLMSANPIRVAISGAGGKMGTRLIALVLEQPEYFRLAAALESAASPLLGRDCGAGVRVSAALTAPADVLIDFSAPAATRLLLDICRQKKINMVIGTTGLTSADHALIDAAAKDIAILQAANTSLGVNVLLRTVADMARQLGSAYDIEIVEAHHNQKKDAPSGTALALADSIAKATGRSLDKHLVHGRHGTEAPRIAGTIGMHALRLGDVVGEHTVYFAAAGERVEVKHIASTRDTFVRGALQAARFISGKTPGRYSMADVLGM
jgi:4-hydroxy-tetrahydrodipicolinate reductase